MQSGREGELDEKNNPSSLNTSSEQQILHSMQLKKQASRYTAHAHGLQCCHAAMAYHGQRSLLGRGAWKLQHREIPLWDLATDSTSL